MTKSRNKGGNGSRSGRKSSGRQKKSYPVYEGRVQMTREGFIFVIVDGQEDDIYVKEGQSASARAR